MCRLDPCARDASARFIHCQEVERLVHASESYGVKDSAIVAMGGHP